MVHRRRETWEEYRRRLLEETSRFIEWGLAHPDEVLDLPLKPESEVGFPSKVGEWFWSVVLRGPADAGTRHWWRKLAGTGKRWRRRPGREPSGEASSSARSRFRIPP